MEKAQNSGYRHQVTSTKAITSVAFAMGMVDTLSPMGWSTLENLKTTRGTEKES